MFELRDVQKRYKLEDLLVKLQKNCNFIPKSKVKKLSLYHFDSSKNKQITDLNTKQNFLK